MDDMKKNKFVMFHTEQATVLVILHFGAIIARTILYSIFWPIGTAFWLINIFTFILWIMGIINAANGKTEPLPVVGVYGEKFNFVK